MKLFKFKRVPESRAEFLPEGELMVSVAVNRERNAVIVNFGKSLSRIGLTKLGAIAFADNLKRRASELK